MSASPTSTIMLRLGFRVKSGTLYTNYITPNVLKNVKSVKSAPFQSIKNVLLIF